MKKYQENIDYASLNRRCCENWHAVAAAFAPHGIRSGREYITLNPHRSDTSLGSFSINTHTGCWGDFATGDYGGDWISWVAFLRRQPNSKAAELIAETVGE